ALAAGLPVLQPPRLRDAEWPERLRALGADVAVVGALGQILPHAVAGAPGRPERRRALGADVAVVVAFGQILPQAVLDAPARGSINVHASLLPRYRGAPPRPGAALRRGT